jgi:hypothetical protein
MRVVRFAEVQMTGPRRKQTHIVWSGTRCGFLRLKINVTARNGFCDLALAAEFPSAQERNMLLQCSRSHSGTTCGVQTDSFDSCVERLRQREYGRVGTLEFCRRGTWSGSPQRHRPPTPRAQRIQLAISGNRWHEATEALPGVAYRQPSMRSLGLCIRSMSLIYI